MSEGGLLAWKRQKDHHSRGPTGSYTNLQTPLPDPPNGTAWVYIPSTKEWCITQVAVTDAVAVVQGKSVLKDFGEVEDAVVVNDTEYVTHTVELSDTFQGICLKYKVSPTTLRKLNGGFSGSTLSLAPHTLLLPKPSSSSSSNANTTNSITASSKTSGEKSTTTTTPPTEQTIHQFLHAMKFVTGSGHRASYSSSSAIERKEAIAYLDMNDGNLEDAIRDAKDDIGWEGGGGGSGGSK